jgi:hypothetical protein
MSVKTNIPKAMREFEKSIQDLLKDTQSLEASLATQAMDEVRKFGLIKGELKKNSKNQYDNIRASDSGIILHRDKSRKGETKDRTQYKYYGKMRQRQRRYAPRDRGQQRVRKVFHKKKMAVRTGDFYSIFERKTAFTVKSGKLVQDRNKAKITVEKFGLAKSKQTKSITFRFDGKEGEALRLLSYGSARTREIKLDNGKQLKGKKGKRDIVANAIRKTFNRHNRMIQKYINSDYAKRFNKIK